MMKMKIFSVNAFTEEVDITMSSFVTINYHMSHVTCHVSSSVMSKPTVFLLTMSTPPPAVDTEPRLPLMMEPRLGLELG